MPPPNKYLHAVEFCEPVGVVGYSEGVGDRLFAAFIAKNSQETVCHGIYGLSKTIHMYEY